MSYGVAILCDWHKIKSIKACNPIIGPYHKITSLIFEMIIKRKRCMPKYQTTDKTILIQKLRL